jgi:hypothetical protein
LLEAFPKTAAKLADVIERTFVCAGVRGRPITDVALRAKSRGHLKGVYFSLKFWQTAARAAAKANGGAGR